MGAFAGMSTGESWMHEPVIRWDDRPVCERVRMKSSLGRAAARSCPTSVRRIRASWRQHSKSTSLSGWRWQHREGSSPFFRTSLR